MEILFVIDTVKDIERKIALLEEISDQIKFFAKADCVADILKNKNIVNRLVAIYKNNVNVTIDKYIKMDTYVPQPTILYYASAELTTRIINNVREQLKLEPDTIYVKTKLNMWQKVKRWVYQKFIKAIFGMNDEFASIKLQYFSADLMGACVETSFKNHIFTAPNALEIELNEDEGKTYYKKPKFNKNYLYNPIVICLILISYVVLERFFKLPFWSYFLFVSLILATIINWLVMTVKNTFDTRFKK